MTSWCSESTCVNADNQVVVSLTAWRRHGRHPWVRKKILPRLKGNTGPHSMTWASHSLGSSLTAPPSIASQHQLCQSQAEKSSPSHQKKSSTQAPNLEENSSKSHQSTQKKSSLLYAQNSDSCFNRPTKHRQTKIIKKTRTGERIRLGRQTRVPWVRPWDGAAAARRRSSALRRKRAAIPCGGVAAAASAAGRRKAGALWGGKGQQWGGWLARCFVASPVVCWRSARPSTTTARFSFPALSRCVIDGAPDILRPCMLPGEERYGPGLTNDQRQWNVTCSSWISVCMQISQYFYRTLLASHRISFLPPRLRTCWAELQLRLPRRLLLDHYQTLKMKWLHTVVCEKVE